MRIISYCKECGTSDIEIVKDENGKWEDDVCYCNKCKKQTSKVEKYVESPYERTRRLVYATGNKWAIENFNATHN